MRLLRNVFIGLFIIIVMWVCTSRIMTMYEKSKYKAPGIMVEVDDKKMHVYKQGEGENTIVLISGLGTASPVLDYEPLINELSKNNEVVVVEDFGYGWSDMTSKERSVENIVEEIRTALLKADIPGPYILMPHSIGGLYAMYFVNTYPDEVKAVIGIDCTLPTMGKYFNEEIQATPDFVGLFAPSGLARIATLISPENFLPINNQGLYSEDNLKKTKAVSAWQYSNKNVVAEANEIGRNLNKTMDMKFPKELPVLIFARKDTRESREDGKNNISFYETYINNLEKGEIVVLEGHHYLHWTNLDEIVDKVNEFLKEVY